MSNLSISKEKIIAIITFLRELSCCSRCIIRFLGLHISDNETAYQEPNQYINKLVNANNFDVEKDAEQFPVKKLKQNACPTCLDCFRLETVEKFIEKLKSISIEEYKYSSFYFNISFPKCLALRAHSMYLHIKKNFPDVPFLNLYSIGLEPSVEQLHKIFRVVASEIFAKSLNRFFHPKSNLSLLITIGYENDNIEVENFKKIIKRRTSKKNYLEVSRNDISEVLKDIDNDLFATHFSVPPSVPEREVYLEKVDITADTIYLGGRYLKFKRNVGQTPWVVDGVSVAEHNLQDIIFDALSNVLGYNKYEMTFSASGREDVDVRMLGTGRPFYIKIDNPRQRHFSKEQLLEAEKQIIKTELVAVIKLQSVYASDLNRIKLGEQQKKKTYRALCKTEAPNINEVINIINSQEENLKIAQKTVMRVLHRRTLLTRDKIIHHMKAIEVPGHSDLFEIELVTQAGTYVKEFIHGDFKRTEPSISSILGYSTDVVALDCMDINLLWPENCEKSNIGGESKSDVL